MTCAPKNCTVWTEIPVSDLNAAMTFYSEVTGCALALDETGPNPMAIFQPADMGAGVAGHLYCGTPAPRGAGPTIHLAAQGKLEDAIERAKAAGATVKSPPIAIPAGRFAYIEDPDGNSIGLFETA